VPDIRVTGAAEIALVAAACRRLGPSRVIVNTMAKEIRRGTKPIRDAIKARAVQILPRSGGLGRYVAAARIGTLVRRSAKSAGVKIRGRRKDTSGRGGPTVDLHRIDLGRTRHPTFGEAPWHAQTVRPGFFTDAVTDEGLDQLETAVIEAAERAAGAIANG
jgi:hypothetical protein